nr:Aerobic respiration control protein arcA [Raoultella sp. NCTC 9187]
MNLGTVSEERRSVESYKFNGWELDINSRSLVSPNGEQYKLRAVNSAQCCTSAKTRAKSSHALNC